MFIHAFVNKKFFHTSFLLEGEMDVQRVVYGEETKSQGLLFPLAPILPYLSISLSLSRHSSPWCPRLQRWNQSTYNTQTHNNQSRCNVLESFSVSLLSIWPDSCSGTVLHSFKSGRRKKMWEVSIACDSQPETNQDRLIDAETNGWTDR